MLGVVALEDNIGLELLTQPSYWLDMSESFVLFLEHQERRVLHIGKHRSSEVDTCKHLIMSVILVFSTKWLKLLEFLFTHLQSLKRKLNGLFFPRVSRYSQGNFSFGFSEFMYTCTHVHMLKLTLSSISSPHWWPTESHLDFSRNRTQTRKTKI